MSILFGLMWRQLNVASDLTPPLRSEIFFDTEGKPTIKFSEFLESLVRDIFINENNVSNITSSETFETSASSSEYHDIESNLENIEDFIPRTQVREFTPDVVTSNVIAVNNAFKDIRSNATVTMDPNASWNDQIITTNGDGSVVKVTSVIELRYAGKRSNTFTLNREGTSIHWYLFVNGTEKFWRGS